MENHSHTIVANLAKASRTRSECRAASPAVARKKSLWWRFPRHIRRNRFCAAYEAGVRHFGENRVQEWEAKQTKVADLDAIWHLVGHLQSNKARRAAQLFRRVDSLDDLALAKRLHAAADAEGKCLPVLIEVHIGGEETKSGVAEADLPSLAASIAPFAHWILRD